MLAQAVQSSMILKLLRTSSLLFPVLCAGLALTVMLASVAPARRAIQSDPMEALRCE